MGLTIESGISNLPLSGFGLRRVRVDGLKNDFILARVFVEDTRYFQFAIIDETTGTLIVAAVTLHEAIYRFNEFASAMEQSDMDAFIERRYDDN